MATVLTTFTRALLPAGQVATRTPLLNSVLWEHPECSIHTFNTYVSKLIKLGCLIPVDKGVWVVSPRPLPTTTGILAVEFYRISGLEASMKGSVDLSDLEAQVWEYLRSQHYSGHLVVSLRNEWCVIYDLRVRSIISSSPITDLHLTTTTGDPVTNAWITFNLIITHATSH